MDRSGKLAGIIALFLGTFGAHKFYNGSYAWGIIYLLLCWTSVPTIVSAGEGLLSCLDDEWYQRRYNQTPPNLWKW